MLKTLQTNVLASVLFTILDNKFVNIYDNIYVLRTVKLVITCSSKTTLYLRVELIYSRDNDI